MRRYNYCQGNEDNFGATIQILQTEDLVRSEKMSIKVMVAGDHF